MSLYKINYCQNHKLQPLIINRSQSLKRVTNPDVQSVDLGYDALEDETSDDSPGENNTKQGPRNAETKPDVDDIFNKFRTSDAQKEPQILQKKKLYSELYFKVNHLCKDFSVSKAYDYL